MSWGWWRLKATTHAIQESDKTRRCCYSVALATWKNVKVCWSSHESTVTDSDDQQTVNFKLNSNWRSLVQLASLRAWDTRGLPSVRLQAMKYHDVKPEVYDHPGHRLCLVSPIEHNEVYASAGETAAAEHWTHWQGQQLLIKLMSWWSQPTCWQVAVHHWYFFIMMNHNLPDHSAPLCSPLEVNVCVL